MRHDTTLTGGEVIEEAHAGGYKRSALNMTCSSRQSFQRSSMPGIRLTCSTRVGQSYHHSVPRQP